MDQKRLIEQLKTQNGEKEEEEGEKKRGFLVSDELQGSDSCPAPAADAATRRSTRTVHPGWRVKKNPPPPPPIDRSIDRSILSPALLELVQPL